MSADGSAGDARDDTGARALEAEFETQARWTVEAVTELGTDHALPAACRGTAAPAGFVWLADALGVGPGTAFLDTGAGLGGPAGWLASERGCRPVLTEPMPGACAGARRMFGLAAVAAWSQALPFADAAFDAAWSLGVLSTTADKAGIIGELRRVLRPAGRLGLLVYVRPSGAVIGADAPAGDDFTTWHELELLLAGGGFDVTGRRPLSELDELPGGWGQRAAAVEDLVERRHGDDPVWRLARDNSAAFGRLLSAGSLQGLLVHAVAR